MFKQLVPIFASVFLLLSCRHTTQDDASSAALLRSHLSEAEEKALAEAAEAELARRRNLAEDRLLQETKESFTLPDTYGETLIISPERQPEIESGPMEDLVNQRVTIKLTEADLPTIVNALNAIAGLNVIADANLSEAQTLMIDVKDVPLKEVLGYIARNMGVAFHVGANTIWVTQSEEIDSGAQLETRIFHLNSGDLANAGTLPEGSIGSGGGGGLGGGFGMGGALSSDDTESELFSALVEMLGNGPSSTVLKLYPKRNLLLVRDTRENLRLVEQMLREFDKPPPQVVIEARFLSVGSDDIKEIGTRFDSLRYSSSRSRTKLDFGEGSSDIATPFGPLPYTYAYTARGAQNALNQFAGSSTFSNVVFPDEGLNATISGVLGSLEYDMVLHALARQGRTRVLSAPRVTVANNQTARIRRGERRWYFEEFDIATTGSGDNERDRLVPVGTPAELELGITLSVSVNVAKDGRIMMNLRPEISDFIEWEFFETAGDRSGTVDDDDSAISGGALKLPRTQEALVETTVIVQSGETVVLGGTQISRDQESEQKVPLLGDIPLIGALFRYRSKREDPQHLVIFVTARLLTPSGHFVQYEMTPILP